ncbi:MAG TPA: tetratricopeptide repeat protein [Opitutaceae bacterium]
MSTAPSALFRSILAGLALAALLASADRGRSEGSGPSADAEITGLLHLGEKLTARGDFSTAEISYWQVLHRPDAAIQQQNTALLGLAHMYRRAGSLTKAEAIYEHFIKDRPEDERVPDALLESGRTLREMGAYKLALNRFYNVINSTLKFPSSGFEHYESLAKTAQFEIAETHFEAGEYEDASKYFLKVRLLDLAAEDRARAHFMAAFSQIRAGDGDEGVVTLKGFLHDWPNDVNNPEARYLLATTLRQLHRPDEAMAVALDLLKAERRKDKDDPSRWAYWQRRTGNQVANELFQNGDIFNALSIYRGLQALSLDPAWRLPVSYQVGLCYERLGQLDKAGAAYTEVSKGPDPELAEMASWRLAHLAWRDNTDREFSAIFRIGPHDSPGSASAAPSDLRRTSPAGAGGESIPAAAPASAGKPAS